MTKNINILSLFDGISCTQIALKNLGIKVSKYFASEIDKYPIQITQKNFPDTIQLGDIKDIKGKDLPEIDLVVAGSPCQGFSFAGKQKAFKDERSTLFFEFVRVLKEVKPKYFLLENVRMRKEFQEVINKAVGVEPILINSALVSAQNRNRLYWTNIPGVEQPEDLGIILKDVLECNYIEVKGGAIRARSKDSKGKNVGWKETKPKQVLEIRKDDKSNSLTSVTKDSVVIEEELNWRKLMPVEAERLQTVPDNYTEGVPSTQRYKSLGNGFTVKVIEHILKNMEL